MSFVPEQPTVFVGRERDLAALGAWFDEGARLVTLVAPGGMGKTRLAACFAASSVDELSEHGGGGVWFCDLSEALDQAAACSTLAATLGLTEASGAVDADGIDRLGREIDRMKRVLIVLDNVEQIAVEIAMMLRAWLRLARHARFLVTSRVALAIAGEQVLALEPLSLPDEDTGGDALLETEAVALFLRRAREVRPTFSAEGDDLLALREVVGATDGIPLAIELAAARLRVLSLGQMKRRLRAPLELLERTEDSGRHASMRRAILDSLGLLSSAERACLAGASVFHAGFSLEAAEHVLGDAGEPVLSMLDVLVSRSLVRAKEIAGEVRFSLLVTIRDVAFAELSGEKAALDRIRARHATFYLRFASDALAELDDGASNAMRAAIERDLPNLLSAYQELQATPETRDRSLAIVRAIAPVLLARSEFAHLSSLLDAWDPARGSAVDRARAALLRGIASYELGDTQRARGELEEARGLAAEANDHLVAARASVRLGELVELLGDTAGARAELERGLGLLREAPRTRAARLCQAEAHARMGHAARREGDRDTAEREAKRALLLYREVGSEPDLPRALYEVGVLSLFRGEHALADASFAEGLEIARRTSQRQAEGALLSGRGISFQEQAELSRALADHAAAVRIFHEIGSRHREASALYYLGAAFLEQGSTGAAEQLLSRAREVVADAGIRRYVVLTASALAIAAAKDGDRVAVERWWSEATRAAEDCRSERALGTLLEVHAITLRRLSGGTVDTATLSRAKESVGRAATDDVRFALRLLAKACDDTGAEREPSLLIRAEAASFRLPGAGDDVDLRTRLPLRRVLLRLAELRQSAPGEALTLDEIVATAWPDERIREAAARNRVRVALATLRKLGLRDVIVTGRGGYLIDPAVAVTIET